MGVRYAFMNIKTIKETKISSKIGKALYYVFRLALLVSIGYIIIYPMLFIITSSVKPVSAYYDTSVIWIPKTVTSDFFKLSYEVLDYSNSLKSTLLYEMVSAGIEILSCSLVAYGLARFEFKGKRILNFILLLTILVPSQMTIIPMMMQFSKFDVLGIFGALAKITGIDIRPNLLGTVGTFYLPSLFAVGLRSGIIIYIYIQFFKGLPKELEEAAWIDGAGLARTFLSIALPSSGVVFVTNTIFALIWHWNDYYLAVMYLSEKFPLAVRIFDFSNLLTLKGIWGGYEASSAKSAACLLFIAPMLVFYLIMQRKFVKSIDRVGITG